METVSLHRTAPSSFSPSGARSTPIVLGTLVLLLVGLWDIIALAWQRDAYRAAVSNVSTQLAVAAGLTLAQAGLIAGFLTILVPPWRHCAAAGLVLAALMQMLSPPAGIPGSAVARPMALVLTTLTIGGLLMLRCLGYHAPSWRGPRGTRIEGGRMRFRIWDLLVVTTGISLLLALASDRPWSSASDSTGIVAPAMAAGLALTCIASFGTLLLPRFRPRNAVLLLPPCAGTLGLAAVAERSWDVSLYWTVLAATYTGVVIGVIAVARTAGLRFTPYLPRDAEKGLGRSIARVIEKRS